MSDFDRIEEARERNEGLYYDTRGEQVMERHEVTYIVTISVPDDTDGDPDPEEIIDAIYKGMRDIDTRDAIDVERDA